MTDKSAAMVIGFIAAQVVCLGAALIVMWIL
ncbi:hypothetical protein HNQ99_002711 [Rhizorhapis suberifaciens]|uniref:Uncharacterized protein n=1 Tax=Rhizorhapis suberifaciens TaxID=13656 RepID=A0A840HY79_9SPHN|nr:hypothetical protein [Rhizorhapis suberifaciens]